MYSRLFRWENDYRFRADSNDNSSFIRFIHSSLAHVSEVYLIQIALKINLNSLITIMQLFVI